LASVNNQLLREEFDALEGRFAALCAEGKMADESRVSIPTVISPLGGAA